MKGKVHSGKLAQKGGHSYGLYEQHILLFSLSHPPAYAASYTVDALSRQREAHQVSHQEAVQQTTLFAMAAAKVLLSKPRTKYIVTVCHAS